MIKGIKLKAKDLKKLIEGLYEIQAMALIGYKNSEDNQDKIAMKVIDILRLLNSTMISEEINNDPKKFIHKYNIQDEPEIELKTKFIEKENKEI